MQLKNNGGSLLDCMISLAIMSIAMLGLAQLNLLQLVRLTQANELLRALGSASDTAAIHSANSQPLLNTMIILPLGLEITADTEHELILVDWISAHGGQQQLTLPLP